MAYARQIRSDADPRISSQTTLTVRDLDRVMSDFGTVTRRYPFVDTAQFHCADESQVPVERLAQSLPLLHTLWLKSMKVLRQDPPETVCTLVLTNPLKHEEDLPSLDWIQSKHGCASLACTNITTDTTAFEFLDRLGASNQALQCLYLAAQDEPIDPRDGIKVFNAVATHHLYLLNPATKASILTDTMLSISSLLQTRFELSPSLRVLWLDCFFATSFFLTRLVSGRRVVLPDRLHTLMLALAPYGSDIMSQISSMVAVKELCKCLQLRKLVLKLPFLAAKANRDTFQWVRTASAQFTALVNQGKVQELWFVPDEWITAQDHIDTWRSMCGTAGSQHIQVRTRPFIPGPEEALHIQDA